MPAKAKQAAVEWREAEVQSVEDEVLGTEKDAKSLAASFESNYQGSYPFEAYTDWEKAQETVIPGDDTVLIAELKEGEELNVNQDRWQQMKQRVDEKFLDQHFEETGDSQVRVKESVGIGTGAVKHTGNKGVLELGGATIWPPFWRTKKGDTGTGVYESALDARRDWATAPDKMDGDINFTQTVTSRHAKTGHMFDKKGYVVEGIMDKKYPEVWDDEGRETVVRQTDAARNDYQFTESAEETPDVYFPDEFASLVDHVLPEINKVREEQGKETLDRNRKGASEYGSLEEVDEYFKVKVKEDSETSMLASMDVVPVSGDYSNSDPEDVPLDDAYDEVLDAEGVAQRSRELAEREDIDWTGINFDANEESSEVMASYLMNELGYDPERFSPESMRYDQDGELQVRDALSVQYRPEGQNEDGTNEIQLIDEAYDVAQKMGLGVEDSEYSSNSPHSNLVKL